MTLWAFLSDVHGRGDRLARVLSDARGQGATRIVALGDIASTYALDLLDAPQVHCVFGNWECSGLRGLPAPYRNWVASWPARFRGDDFWAAHASPVWPKGLGITGVVEYLRMRNQHWTSLFPSLQRSDEARWAALAELEEASVPIFFHGHTHSQEAWCWTAGGALVRAPSASAEITIDDRERWLIGVGSVGDPHDGPGACYALFDPQHRLVTWRRI